MKRSKTRTAALLRSIDSALSLLETPSVPHGRNLVAEPLPSLLRQCEYIRDQAKARPRMPIRTIHHFACTGGTFFAKCIAATPNTRVLSEIDPLSPIAARQFAPSDLIRHLHHDVRGADPQLVLDIFMAGVARLYDWCEQRGTRLIFRDHSHSHFCTGPQLADRPALRDILEQQFPTLSVLTVRHPMESYLALAEKKTWFHFSPTTLEEYACRYLAFLDAYKGVPIYRYEDMIENPQEVMEALCGTLALPFSEHTLDIFSTIELTGDSGRRSDVIAHRPRRAVPADIAEQAAASAAFTQLCKRLDYTS